MGVLLWVCAGVSALHRAANEGHAAVAEVLLAKGADVNLQNRTGTRSTEGLGDGGAWVW